MRADLNLLPTFLALMEERNVTRAAARMGMTQPALSNALRALEESLGVAIVTTRMVGPTASPMKSVSPVSTACGARSSFARSCTTIEMPSGVCPGVSRIASRTSPNSSASNTASSSSGAAADPLYVYKRGFPLGGTSWSKASMKL